MNILTPAPETMPKPVLVEPKRPDNFNELTWHAVRLPRAAGTRGSEAPAPDSIAARDRQDMLKWISKNKVDNWWREQLEDGGSAFWFELRDDAMAFATRWFPYRGL